MKNKVISSFLAICMLFALLPLTASADEPKPLTTPIKLGDYVYMGTYNGSSILWRCVAFEKISGYDEDGNPITDSTKTVTEYEDGYLPLMLADKSICNKEFDAAGIVTTGSHGRDNANSSRQKYGSNYWGDSNIRDWLNSSESAGNVKWTCGNSPSYANEAGFLTNFTDAEKKAIKTVTQKSLLTEVDQELKVDGASAYHTYGSHITEVVQNYTIAYAENITDTMFLLDVQQLYNVYKNYSSYYRLSSVEYFLRSPSASASASMRYVDLYSYVPSKAPRASIGIRPAFYLNQQSVIFTSGDGTSESPYLSTIPDQTYTGSEIEPDVTIKDGDTTLVAGTDYTVTYSNNINVGTATVTVTGMGNYSGTATTSFTINKADISPVVSMDGWTYGETANEPSVSGNAGGGAVTYQYKVSSAEDSDYSDTVPSNAGTYTVKATVAETDNYNGGTATTTFNIVQKPLAAPIKLGDYVQMGTYDTDGDGTAEPILWRCVAFEKISCYDDKGNPITDSTDTVTEYEDGYLPLMLADKSICNKEFDAAGIVTTGSHGRDNANSSRQKYGSNYWGDSNIRDWLNSSESAGNVKWTCGNSPSYANEAGFLTNFTDAEKKAIKTVTQKSLLSNYDKELNTVDGESAAHTYSDSIGSVVQNYATAYAENITDTMFLLDVRQLYNVYANDSSLGNSYYKNAMAGYWLRSPYSERSGSDSARGVAPAGSVLAYYDTNDFGVRPAFYLNQQSVIFTSGDGTSTNPYLSTIPDQTYTGSEIKPDITIKDGETTLVEGTDYTIEYSNNINAGTATVTVTGMGNYTGTATTDFTIVKAGSQTTAENKTVTYGETLTLTANVSKQLSALNSLSLFSVDADKVEFYVGDTSLGMAEVTYDDDTAKDSGTATLTINTVEKQLAIGANTITAVYGGSINLNGSENDSITVTLNKKQVGLTWSGYDTRDYDKNASSVTAAATGVEEGDSVTVTVTGGAETDAGEHTATAALTGTDAEYYALPEAATQSYTISKARVTAPTITNKIYTGEILTADVAASDIYSVSANDGGVNVGEYDVVLTLTDSDNYTWQDSDDAAKTLKFNITQATNAWTTEPSVSDVTYPAAVSPDMGAAKFGDVSVTYAGTDDTSYEESATAPTAAGSYTAKFSVAGTDNYTGLSKEVSFTIAKAGSQTEVKDNQTVTYGETLTLTANVSKQLSAINSLSLLSVDDDKVEFYVGDTLLGTAEVTYDDDTAKDSGTAELTINTVNKQLAIGDNTITAVYGGSINLNGSGSDSITVKLNQKQVGLTWSGYDTRDYDKNASSVTAAATGVEEGDSVTVTVTGGAETNAGTYTATATGLTGTGAEYYALSETSMQSYTINQTTPDYTIPTGLTAIIGKTLESVVLPNGWSWSDSSASVGAIGNNEFTAVFTPDDTVNYNSVTETLTVTVGYAAAEIKRGESVIREDETVTYNEDCTVTIDKDGDGSAEVTITVPDDTESVTVDENGNVIVPDNGTVKVGENEEITLPSGGTVDNDGNVTGETVEVGDTTITAPENDKVTTDKNGNTEVTAGTTVEKDNVKITIDEGNGTVDKDGNITFPEGGKVTVEYDGTTTAVDVEAGGTVNPGSFSVPSPTPTVKKSSGGGTVSYKVSFDVGEHGKITSGSATVSVKSGSKVKEENVPTVTANDGYVFLGWSADGETVADVTAAVIKKATTFTALYETSDAEPTNVPSETDAPSETDKPTATDAPENPFTDVSESDWFFDDVINAYQYGLMSGVSNTEFAPYMNITRGMFVTVLYRMEGEPETALDYTFTDVSADEYYTNAVAWACENNIVSGYSEQEYAPDDIITREQMAAIIYRCAKLKGYDTSINGGISYADSGDISDYAKDAVVWSADNGIMIGNTDNTFTPQNNTTRAEAAAVFTRIAEKLK